MVQVIDLSLHGISNSVNFATRLFDELASSPKPLAHSQRPFT
jgi:hypothetical protein